MFLKRDTKVYLEKGSDIWEIPVMSGFNFSQGNTTSEIVLREMATAAGVSRRGRRVFNDAIAPADWSFSTYIRPFKSAGSGVGKADGTLGNHHAIEEALWANFVGLGTYTAGTFSFLNFESPNTTDIDIAFTGGNNISLGTFNLYFVLGAGLDGDQDYDDPATDDVVVYKIANCVVNQATINFDVDGIATVEWTGMGTTITVEANFDASAAIIEGISATTNFIRNKLTALYLLPSDVTNYPGADAVTAGAFVTGKKYRITTVGDTDFTAIGATASTVGVVFTATGAGTGTGTAKAGYDITLTGGSITFSNNVQYLTPETLGIVNTPIGHIAGNKSVSGNFTAYVEEESGETDTSAQLLADALGDLSTITNSFYMTFVIGGVGNVPRMEVSLPTAHLEIPKIQSDDVISVDVAFHGLPSTISLSDEATLKYVGTTL